MKGFWDNLFYDMDECGLDRSGFAMKAGREIRDVLVDIDNDIKNHNPKKAMARIREAINDF